MPTTPDATAPARTHCPTCGMKIAREDLSICSYCSAPLHLEREPRRSSETQKRLARMKDHAGFAAAVAHRPAEPLAIRRGRRESARARWLAGACALACVLAWRAEGGAVRFLFAGGGIALGALAVRLFQQGAAAVRNTDALPLLRRPALVLERRSETNPRGLAGETIYFFQLEFEDGSVGEFRQAGRGAQHEPLVNGNTGVAHTRGSELLDFIVLKV